MKIINEKIDIADRRNAVVERLEKSGLPVAVYGAGKFAKDTALYLYEKGITVTCFCVDDQYYDTRNVEILVKSTLIKVVPLKELNQFGSPCNVVIAFIDYKRAKYVMDHGQAIFPNSEIVVYLDGVTSHYMSKAWVLEHEGKLLETYQMLEDELSKEILLESVYSRMRGTPETLCKLMADTEETYDWTLLKINENENFVDCGAYDGDTVREFLSVTEGSFEKIWALEPDSENFEKLREMELQCQNVECVKKGAWKENAQLQFSTEGTMGSAISQEGRNVIEAMALDCLEGWEKVSFIKMDIEGSELEALQGAKKLIRLCTPKLAICVYHRIEDLITIPQYIREIAGIGQYKFYLRQHSNSVEETVLYAIP